MQSNPRANSLFVGSWKKYFHLLILFFFALHPSTFFSATHTRLYACVLANEAPGSFMGGSSMGAGLWQSDDTATTWKQIGWKHVKCYSVDVVNRSNGKIMYQACGNGVLRSHDAGATWKMVTDWRMTEVMDVVIDQVDPKNVYIATAEAIWKSMDGGDSWFEADTDIPEPRFTSRLKIDPNNHLKVFASTETGIYISKNGGVTWSRFKGSTSSGRDMIVGKNGVLAWVDNYGGFFENGVRKPIRADSLGGLWSIIRRKDHLIVSGSRGVFTQSGRVLIDSFRNIHSLEIIGTKLIMGSLSGGVWKKELLDDESIPSISGLEQMQVWRIKALNIE